MRIRRALVSILVTVASGCSKPTPIVHTTAKAPATRVEPVTDTVHGVAIVDDYRWLEGNNTNTEVQGEVTPEVATWTDGQNAYTRQVLDTLPGRAAVEVALKPMEIGCDRAHHAREPLLLFEAEGTQNQPILLARRRVSDSRADRSGKLDSTGPPPSSGSRRRQTASCSRMAPIAPATK